MFAQVSSIARNTFTESIRQPIYVVLIGLIGILLVLATTWAAYTLGEDDKLLIDMGLSMMMLGGLALAAFTAAGVLAREIDNKTVLTVISKPIGRPYFILGKYLGVVAAVSVAFWIWSVIFLMCVRHGVMSTAADKHDQPVIVYGCVAAAVALGLAVWGNYFYNWVFTSRFSTLLAITLTAGYAATLVTDKTWAFQSPMHEFVDHEGQLVQVLIAMALVFEVLLVISAVAIAASTRLGQVATLGVCIAVLGLGMFSEYLFLRHTADNAVAWVPFAAIYNVQFTFMADALTQKSTISGYYVGLVSAYTACYICAVICLAIALFQTRETG